jgi:hypothetical protein
MKASLFTTLCLVMVLAACGQPVQGPGASVETGNSQSGSEAMRQEVRAALQVVPEARPYVDPQTGSLDLRAAKDDMDESAAYRLIQNWYRAFPASAYVNPPVRVALSTFDEPTQNILRVFIDEEIRPGFFNYELARSELGPAEARVLRASWRDALSAARARA